MIGKLIEFLSGRKTTIATIIGALVVFSLGRGWITQDIAELISAIGIACGLSLNLATARYFKNKR